MDITIADIKELGAYGIVLLSYYILLRNLIATSSSSTSALSSSADATRAHTSALQDNTAAVRQVGEKIDHLTRNGNGKA